MAGHEGAIKKRSPKMSDEDMAKVSQGKQFPCDVCRRKEKENCPSFSQCVPWLTWFRTEWNKFRRTFK